MKWLFSTKAFVATSYVLLLGSTVGFIFGVTGVYPKGEPKVILAISWAALIFSAYGNIISSQVNKKVENLDADTIETDELKVTKGKK